jgi:hypothetical protein
MRISDELVRTVVFIGYPSEERGKGGIDCIGTAFLLRYEGQPYLVTVRHVAEYVGGEPFLIRLNRLDADGADNLPIDGAVWFYDTNPEIDVAVLPLDFIDEDKYSIRFIDDAKESWWSNKAWKYGVGIGDFCYTIGLFRVLAGNKRNLPVVHFGTIARNFYTESEPIPLTDWRDPSGQKTIMTEAYLVESQSLSGLSGAPVFVRTSHHAVRQEHIDHNPNVPIDDLGDAVAMWQTHLIGIWQGAWDAPPGEVLAAERGKNMRVPVGMGVVIPIDYVHHILAGDELTTLRVKKPPPR